MQKAIQIFIMLIMVLQTTASYAEAIVTESTSNSTVKTDGTQTTTVISPPPSAITPSINASNTDLCTVGVAGAVQTQILGVSAGTVVKDKNCERLKISKTLYDMGMKVAAVSVLCQDKRVHEAMKMAGTPCPFLGEIGNQASVKWDENPELAPINKPEEGKHDQLKTIGTGVGIGALLYLLLL